MRMIFKDSATVLINTLAQQKMAQGIRVFNLGCGEPKLPAHPAIIEATLKALQEGKTLYPPVAGIPELRELAANWMNQHYGSEFKSENCLVSTGGKLGIYLFLQSTLKKGDEVIIPAPYWVSYPPMTQLFGGVTKIIETSEKQGWKLKPADLKKACTAKSKILILNNGNNPTGAIYTEKELAALLKIAHEYNLLVLSDEVYSELTYGKEKYISCASFKKYRDNVVIIQSCSKSFAMTGWRIGFVFAKPEIIKPLISLTSQSTSGVITIGQYAAITAFKKSKIITAWVRKAMQKRRDILVKAINQYFHLSISPPSSALYIFVSLKNLGVNHLSSAEFCKQALEQANVVLIPGSAFGPEGYVRISFGADEKDLKEGVKVLAEFCRSLTA
jgi:aspartate aminotransferase